MSSAGLLSDFSPAPLPKRESLGRQGSMLGGAFEYEKMKDDQQDAAEERAAAADGQPWIIIPDETPWKLQWDIGILLLILYSAAAVPVRVCFEADAEGFLWLFEVTMSFLFLTDVVFNFRTAYFENGVWVTELGSIADRYMRGWFWIDGPSSLPLELIDVLTGGAAKNLALLRFLRLLRLLRLLKLLKVDDYIEKVEDYLELAVNAKIVDAIMMIVKILFLSHVLGCFWYGVGALSRHCEQEAEEAEEDSSSGRFVGALMDSAAEPRDVACSPTWYSEYSYAGEGTPTIAQLYLWSFYWAVMTLTTTGYGDIVPTNDAERGYMIFMMLVSALSFSYIMSNIASLIASLDMKEAMIAEKIDAVKQYIEFRSVPKPLASRLRRHYKYFYNEKGGGVDEMELLEGCPLALRADLTQFLLKETLGKLSLFKDNVVDDDFQGEFFPHSEFFPIVKPVSFAQGEVIFRKGELSRELLFLLEGEVDVYSARKEDVVDRRLTPTEEIFIGAAEAAHDEKPFAVKHAGCFGEGVLNGERRSATHVARTTVKAFAASKEDLEQIFQKNPRAARRIFSVVLAESRRKQRMHTLAIRMLIAIAPRGTTLWAALYVQYRWALCARRLFSMSILVELEADATKAANPPDAATPKPTTAAAKPDALPAPPEVTRARSASSALGMGGGVRPRASTVDARIGGGGGGGLPDGGGGAAVLSSAQLDAIAGRVVEALKGELVEQIRAEMAAYGALFMQQAAQAAQPAPAAPTPAPAPAAVAAAPDVATTIAPAPLDDAAAPAEAEVQAPTAAAEPPSAAAPPSAATPLGRMVRNLRVDSSDED